jgi:CobQ-like glutamine amidotransferase family enzyme
MNLYGERANPLMLSFYLQKAGVDVFLEKKNFGEEINFKQYDVVYIGSGFESNQKEAAAQLFNYRDEISETIKSGTVFLATGNSFEIFGRNIHSETSSYETLGIFDFEVSEQTKERYSSDIIFETEFCSDPVIGCINKCAEIHGIEDHLFKVNYGIGDFYNSEHEGIRKNNFFGTHVLGPILVRNPCFLKNFSDIVLKRIKTDQENEIPSQEKLKEENLKTGFLNENFENYMRKAYESTLLKLKSLDP